MAIRALQDALRPATAEEQTRDDLVIAIGRQIGLLRPNLASEQKEDWISLVMDELGDLPAGLLLEAMRDVRRGARHEGDVVPETLKIVEPKMLKMRRELGICETLASL